jgi:hypothetical protein
VICGGEGGSKVEQLTSKCSETFPINVSKRFLHILVQLFIVSNFTDLTQYRTHITCCSPIAVVFNRGYVTFKISVILLCYMCHLVPLIIYLFIYLFIYLIARFSFLSFKTGDLIHYFGFNLF